jgi:3-oxoacyl-[acyl-carrier protein] reductase
MAFEFDGRRVVVAGGSRGIGRSIALAFARVGAGVSICARGAEDLARTHAEIAAHARPTHSAGCDLADRDAIFRYIGEAAEALGGIDVLVNNASAFGIKDDEESWAGGMSVDMMATVRAGHAAIPFLEHGTGSCIIDISSGGSLRCGAARPPYAAMKAAVNHYTASLARILAPKRIRVNAIAPGSIEFPGGRWERAPAQQLADIPRDSREHSFWPHGRARGDRRRRAFPRLALRTLDHGSDSRRGRRREPPRALTGSRPARIPHRATRLKAKLAIGRLARNGRNRPVSPLAPRNFNVP